jgi:hypothetical protein
MKSLRAGVQFALFLLVFLTAYVLYQLPDAPTKFIYYNF